MTALQWDQVGERFYETGVDKGVLYLPDSDGNYNTGVAWNGLTTVTEAPSGAAATPQYADNIKYLNLIAAEIFGATVDAFTYPDEFAECDGTATPQPGVTVGQQSRKVFGMSYRTRVGNDIEGTDHGYKLHLVYGAQAAPSQKAYATINDNPAAIAFSWAVTTTPVPVNGLKPTSLIVIDSTKVDPTQLATLEDQLYGTAGTEAQLPHPDNVIAIFSGSVSEVRLTDANAPSYDAATHVVTLPAVANIDWYVDGVETNAGALAAMSVGETRVITAEAHPGYVITGDEDWTFDY
jgi:hypothetical protein